jgi:hypothetical protein
MSKTFRDQADEHGDEISEATATPPDTDGITRQEFKDEADINVLLAKFGVDNMTRLPEYGKTIDYNLDLQQALTAIQEAKNANMQVPPELRSKYPDWRAVLNAAETGQYQADLRNLTELKKREADNAKQEQLNQKEFNSWKERRAAAQARAENTVQTPNA